MLVLKSSMFFDVMYNSCTCVHLYFTSILCILYKLSIIFCINYLLYQMRILWKYILEALFNMHTLPPRPLPSSESYPPPSPLLGSTHFTYIHMLQSMYIVHSTGLPTKDDILITTKLFKHKDIKFKLISRSYSKILLWYL